MGQTHAIKALFVVPGQLWATFFAHLLGCRKESETKPRDKAKRFQGDLIRGHNWIVLIHEVIRNEPIERRGRDQIRSK